MKKKRILGAALAAAIAVTAGFSGCSLVTNTSALDMRTTVAEVNISLSDKASAEDSALFTKYNEAVGTATITKNQLVSYFISYYYSYLQQGYPASTLFSAIIDGLVENAIVTQYAIMYVLNDKAAAEPDALSKYNACRTYAEKLEYLLTDNSSDDPLKELKIARYNLYSSLNSSIDSYEQDLLEDEDDEAGTETRATPTGVDAQTEDYYPAAPAGAEGYEEGDLYYNVYTGYVGNLLTESGAYQDDALTGTSRAQRNLAYNNFINTLASFGLVDPQKDNIRDVANIPYIKEEYCYQLETRVVNKYNDLYEKAQNNKLTDDGKYEYLAERYATDLQNQINSYSTPDDFGSAIGNMNDSTFILYSPDTEGQGAFGLVYNILLPFDALQNKQLSALQAAYSDDETGGYTYKYYTERNKLLGDIQSTDQRAAWFNGETDYSFKPADDFDYYGKKEGVQGYLFFENNLTKSDKYEPLEKYIGKYAYNGTVNEKDGKYILQPNKITIDGMLSEFKAYVDYVCGEGTVVFSDGYVAGEKNEAYYSKVTADNFYTEATKNKKPAEREIDYSNYIYAKGSVQLDGLTPATYKNGLMDKQSAQYKALAAINELQYAYTTDTGVLSNYLGYSVTLGDSTGYIKEFETAAHEAISRGVGSFVVCGGDYGWHLIYVTYVFGDGFDGDGNSTGGNEYAPVWDDAHVNAEGTFENLYYEYIKSTDIASITSKRREQIVQTFKSDKTVTKYEERYRDLLDL